MQFDSSMRGEGIEHGYVDLLIHPDLQTPSIHLKSRIGIGIGIWDPELSLQFC
jgi:hypothetical protein